MSNETTKDTTQNARSSKPTAPVFRSSKKPTRAFIMQEARAKRFNKHLSQYKPKTSKAMSNFMQLGSDLSDDAFRHMFGVSKPSHNPTKKTQKKSSD